MGKMAQTTGQNHGLCHWSVYCNLPLFSKTLDLLWHPPLHRCLQLACSAAAETSFSCADWRHRSFYSGITGKNHPVVPFITQFHGLYPTFSMVRSCSFGNIFQRNQYTPNFHPKMENTCPRQKHPRLSAQTLSSNLSYPSTCNLWGFKTHSNDCIKINQDHSSSTSSKVMTSLSSSSSSDILSSGIKPSSIFCCFLASSLIRSNSCNSAERFALTS